MAIVKTAPEIILLHHPLPPPHSPPPPPSTLYYIIEYIIVIIIILTNRTHHHHQHVFWGIYYFLPSLNAASLLFLSIVACLELNSQQQNATKCLLFCLVGWSNLTPGCVDQWDVGEQFASEGHLEESGWENESVAVTDVTDATDGQSVRGQELLSRRFGEDEGPGWQHVAAHEKRLPVGMLNRRPRRQQPPGRQVKWIIFRCF